MRRTVLLVATMALILLVAGGVALALLARSPLQDSAPRFDCPEDGGMCNGTDASERIYGTPEGDRIDGGGGDDTIHALAGWDTVFDTEGRNAAYGGDGDDWITISGSVYGGPGEDTIEGVFKGGKASGGPGVDLILVHNGKPNTVSCGTGRDHVYFDKELDSLAADCERQIPREFDVPGDVPFSEG